ncbi:Outer membrane receptor proteins, mostly Fe transport [Arachidicoccus rhizosphaerae]|uniref:Outer membrane receptor proteins, mostly Fe transport n=1 Tax=Arachidicoccus rhizosphaerae TaxID=551991 RepID=A0A1H3YF71_9BACT|nr:outer membrane beta-barrel protein [Arachidicoccus rhizosphaerae]SEA10176.1 Outer membrane receptor proteins, mostly Fe transport [Arachidicoccus rhizosphaerae]
MRLRIVVSIIIGFLLIGQLKAQSGAKSGRIYGQIVDTISNNVNRATISLLKAADTASVNRTLSDSTGHFNFKNLDLTTYIMRISFQGYDVVNRYVTISQQDPELNVGEITLQQTLNELGTVVVTAIVPVVLNGDTTEFNADAFGTKPNATVEDLLKKLPGVEVSKDGSIQSQGEAVSRVFVDGKRFFGNDPKLATQNLPKDVVDKIQVFDGKSDQAEFTGFDDGNTIKTINIVTKKDKRKGSFGRSSAGIGNDDAEFKNGLYNINARLFRMDGDKRIGFLGNFNNVNQQMFTRGDGGDNNGLNKTISAGINYRNQISKKTDFSGSYFYNNIHQVKDSKSFNQNLFSEDTSQLTNKNSLGITNNQNHRFDLNIETNFDSSNRLRVRPNLNITRGSSNTTATNDIDQLIDGDTANVSTSNSKNTSNSNSYNASLGTTYSHAFKKAGRSISLDVQLSSSRNENEGTNYADIYTYQNDLDSITNQHYSSVNDNKSISTTLSYTEPIATHQMLQLEINNAYSKTNSDRKTYNYDSTTGSYSDANENLTNIYENTYQSNRATLSYMYNNGDLNFSAGTGVQLGHMKSDNLSKDIHLSQNYVNMYPTASLSYKFSKTRRLRFNYRGRTSQPSVTQLQPVVDNSNQLHITSGNPDLKQEFGHNFMLRYTNFDRENNKTFFATISADVTQNNIVNAIYRLSNGGDSTVPINMNGFYNVSGYLNWGFPLNKPKSNLDLSTRISNQRKASLINDVHSYTYTTTLSQRISWTTNLAELFDINFATNPAYNFANYSVSSNQDGNYYSQSISFDGTWYSKSGWEIGSDFNYTFYAGLPAGQNTAIPIWNAGITKHLFKDQAGELKLSVNDILNQNKGIDFTRTDNIIGWSQSNVLKRYFMLTFTYNLRKFGGKKMRQGPDGGRPPRGDFGGPPGGGFGGGRGGGFGGGGGRGGF